MATELQVVHWQTVRPTLSNDADKNTKSGKQAYLTWDETSTVYSSGIRTVIRRTRCSAGDFQSFWKKIYFVIKFVNVILKIFSCIFYNFLPILVHNQRSVYFRCKSPIIKFWFLNFFKKLKCLLYILKRFSSFCTQKRHCYSTRVSRKFMFSHRGPRILSSWRRLVCSIGEPWTHKRHSGNTNSSTVSPTYLFFIAWTATI